MMATLSSVKSYLEARSRASLTDIALGVATTPEAARALLERWQVKNRVRLVEAACGSCGHGPFGCTCSHAAPVEIWEWIAPTEVHDGAA